MAKKYTIEIDANVSGEKDVKKLSESLDEVAKSGNEASESMDELSTETQEVSENTEQASEKSKGLVASLAQGATTALIYRTAIRSTSKTLIKFAPLLLTVAAGITAIVLAYRAWTQATKNYIASSIEAQKDLKLLTTANVAWDNAWKDLSITIGEFTSKVSRAWTFLKEGVKTYFLITHGQEDYIISAMATNAAVENLTWNFGELQKQIQKLNYVSEDQLEIVNDTNKSLTERMAALSTWKKAQEDILDLELSILQQERLINTEKRERGLAETQELEAIDKKIRENTRSKEKLTKQNKKLTASILANTEGLILESEQFDVSKDIAEAYLKILEDGFTKAAKAKEDYDRAIREEFIFEEEDVTTPEEEDLLVKIQYQKDYEDFLGESLENMGGMWGDYFSTLKDLYDKDVKWSSLSNESKLAIISGTAQATLGIANMLVQQLAEGASEDFETQKKYKIAAATISTLQGMVQAFTGAMQLGPIAGPIVGGILAAATAAMGFANIAKIRATTPDTSSAGGDTGEGAGQVASTAAPSFSLINPLTQGETQLSQVNNTDLEPPKSYVISEEVSTQQALDRNITSQAKI